MEQEPLNELEQLRRLNKQLERDVAHLVQHDQLTGLLNRNSFVSEVDKQLQLNATNKINCAMIEIGMRGLPRITGSLGRHVGDYAISALAARLNMMNKPYSLKCRLDYWSFAIFIPQIEDPLEALTIAKTIIENLGSPIDWVDRKLTVELGAGVALSSEGQYEAVELLQNAGLALKSSTEKGGPGYSFFNPQLAQHAKRRTDVLSALQESSERQLMSLNYQPFYKANSGELVGFEALMRMNHAELGVNAAPAYAS